MGIIANNAVLFPPESNKATQFIRLCNTRNTPIVFLQNSAVVPLSRGGVADEETVTGFMVGKKYEEVSSRFGRRYERKLMGSQAGIIKAGSLFINAVSNSHVPHLTIMCGSSFGAGNYAMVRPPCFVRKGRG